MCTLYHKTHENTPEASNHTPQVNPEFIGFSNNRASLFDLARGIFLIEATRHGIVNCPSRIPAGLGKLVRPADLKGGVHKAFFFHLNASGH